MPRLKAMRRPNGFGTIVKLSKSWTYSLQIQPNILIYTNYNPLFKSFREYSQDYIPITAFYQINFLLMVYTIPLKS